MFNLEQAISDWRREMLEAGVKSPEIVDELESHLREDVARRMETGTNVAEAFEEAVQGMGHGSLLKQEFAKLGRKWRGLRDLKERLAKVFVPVPCLSSFSDGARRTLELARLEAPRRQHGFIGTEHVLLGLLALEEGGVSNVLKRLGVDREVLKQQIENWISDFPVSKMPERLPYTLRVQKTLRLAASQARELKRSEVGAEEILLGLLLEGDGVAGRVLRNLGLSYESVREEISNEKKRIRRAVTHDEGLAKQLRFLQELNTGQMPHSDRGLLDHLLGTRDLLVEWEARPALCDAGLFHSIYSTDHYELEALPLSRRDEVQQLIGEEAESLVWLFCSMRRETLYDNLNKERELSVQHRLTGEAIPLTEGQFRDLVTLSFANCLEAFPRCGWRDRWYIRLALRSFRDKTIPLAQEAFDEIDARWWEIWK